MNNKTFSRFEMGKVMSPAECVMLPSCAVVMLLLKLFIIIFHCIGRSVLSDVMSVGVINVDVVHDKRGFFSDQLGLQTIQNTGRRGLT
jgi:hypothetical protein